MALKPCVHGDLRLLDQWLATWSLCTGRVWTTGPHRSLRQPVHRVSASCPAVHHRNLMLGCCRLQSVVPLSLTHPWVTWPARRGRSFAARVECGTKLVSPNNWPKREVATACLEAAASPAPVARLLQRHHSVQLLGR